MKIMIGLLLALMLALPMTSSGEGAATPADRFIERTGIEADAEMREKIEAFLREQGITAALLERIDDDRLSRYAEHLSADLPIAYPALLEAPSEPLPQGAAIRQIAVMVPQGAAMESLLVDFERGRVYYDETFPVPEDVCRARCAGPLSDADGAKILALLDGAALDDAPGAIIGVELGAIRLAIGWDGGVTRCLAGGSKESMNLVYALLDAGRAAAQGEK